MAGHAVTTVFKLNQIQVTVKTEQYRRTCFQRLGFFPNLINISQNTWNKISKRIE